MNPVGMTIIEFIYNLAIDICVLTLAPVGEGYSICKDCIHEQGVPKWQTSFISFPKCWTLAHRGLISTTR